MPISGKPEIGGAKSDSRNKLRKATIWIPDRRFAASGMTIARYAALTRRKPFHIAVAAPDINTFR